MRVLTCLALVLVCVPVAWGQAITGFSGGTEYDSYYGSASGDVIGWRFTVSQQIWVSDLGVWNADQTGGLESPHIVGIWDESQTLLDSVTVDNAGTVVGDWMYYTVTPFTLMPGETYTIGALYFSGDDDWYISGASSVASATEVTWLNSVYPAAAEMGFVFPTLDSAASSGGRFGPNFIFTLTSLQHSTWGAIKTSAF
jgi:hypothetical protein